MMVIVIFAIVLLDLSCLIVQLNAAYARKTHVAMVDNVMRLPLSLTIISFANADPASQEIDARKV